MKIYKVVIGKREISIEAFSVSPSGRYFVVRYGGDFYVCKAEKDSGTVLEKCPDWTDYDFYWFDSVEWFEEYGFVKVRFSHQDYFSIKTERMYFDRDLYEKEKAKRRKKTMDKIRIGIAGYGNLGKGVELAVRQNDDMELAAIFTRRDPSALKPLTEGVNVQNIGNIKNFKDKIDVLIICGGSATDLPEQTPELAKNFNVIDSFDTHARIPEHFANVDSNAKMSNHLAIISLGWDPGLFSLNRLYAESILPDGKSYTFWGKGVSQGHSDAIRRVKGVKRGIQYTIPVEEAMEAVRSGSQPELSTRQKHTRECWIVAEEGADLAQIENDIKTMKNYFDEYDTTVNFITEEEFDAVHNKMPHGGFVMRSGVTGEGGKTHQMIEYSLKLDSNPEFTASVLICYARALARLRAEGKSGCLTAFDIAPAYLSRLSAEELRAKML